MNVLEKAGYEVEETSMTNKISQTVIINKNNVQDAYLSNISDLIQTGQIVKSKNTSEEYDITIILGEQ